MTEEQMLSLVRRTEIFRKLGLGCLLLGLIVIGGGLTELLPGDPGDVGDRLEIFVAIGAVLVVAGVVLMFLGRRLPPEAKTGRVALIRAEQLQSRRQIAFLMMPLSLLLMMNGVMRATGHVADGLPLRHIDLFVVGCFLFFILVFAALLAGRGLDRWARPILDDELSRALRAKALQFGYLILLPGVAVLFAVGLFRRDIAFELTPMLAALGVIGPAVRLFLLERAAGAGAEA